MINYGFCLSSNSILCFTKNDIQNFDFSGYEIFEDQNSSVFDVERRKIVINKITKKIFELGDKKKIIKILITILFLNKIKNIIIIDFFIIIYNK